MLTQILTLAIILSIIGLITTFTHSNSIAFSDSNYSEKIEKYKARKLRFGLSFFALLVLSLFLIDKVI
ncbi:hypothetical protein KU06062659_790005 [Flavobacterium psychrophilum]|nr:hypothetical protein SU65_11920 [Flavobacterium psychrophilum]OUD28841.1 hypothetical protein FPG92_01480 [Flavobacterium psychrophilum]SNA76239.1 hypothetical protein FI070_270001 [Flavobacterium psychrophilum]SNB17192.1 hypothetical protein KU06062604_430050 [Flavobacterium psychrophilum]SNB21826.1 hypothetical protein KU06062659_790005 [Flavobacterium psychrophilum]